MRYFVLVLALSVTTFVTAEDTVRESAELDASVRKGLDFLAKDAVKWKNDYNCVSCHHASFVVWSMREAKQKRWAVDEDVLADMTKWMAEAGEGKTGVPRPPGRPKALNTKAVYFALALAANPSPDELSRDGLKKMLNTIKEDQLEDGSWHAWPNSRSPMFGRSDDSMTGLATLAASLSNDDTMKEVRDRGVRWLSETKSDEETQSLVVRLLLWQKVGKPELERNQLIQKLEHRQNADGGWSQNPEMSSDAWATGQAIYALSYAGVKPSDSVIARGRGFLIKTQNEDGSWPMASRPIEPDGKGATTLVPIIGGGSAWAVLGLVRGS
jgi:prenyltransferase beta subunit